MFKFMKTDLDYLPERKQRELSRAVSILFEELQEAVKEASSDWKKNGRIVKIVLFGSYARGEWVDEPHTDKGYQSDFDLLVVVNYKRVAEELNECWHRADDRIMRDESIKTPVSFIVHTLTDVNDKLKKGQYFFSEIIKQGVLIYDLKGTRRFALPKPLTAEEALETARDHFDQWMPSARNYGVLADKALTLSMLKQQVFLLHQSVEHAYSCLLLVVTNYSPSTHNIKFLRSLCEDIDLRLEEAWPRRKRFERRCFALLKKAYVEARYSRHYEITEEEVAWLAERAGILQTLVETICKEHLAKLSREASDS